MIKCRYFDIIVMQNRQPAIETANQDAVHHYDE